MTITLERPATRLHEMGLRDEPAPPTPYRIIVTGSRDWSDRWAVAEALIQARDEAPGTGRDQPPRRMLVRHGGARGADAHADYWARSWRWLVEEHPVTKQTWRTLGARAGRQRNQHMVNLGAELCVAFLLPCSQPTCKRPDPHGSHGTTDCIEKATEAGIPVWAFGPEGRIS